MAMTLTREQIKTLYAPPANQIVEVNVPPLKYVVIDGTGDPAKEAYQHAIKWLFATIVPLRKIAKQKLGTNFVEPPLETLYWADGDENLNNAPKSRWRWRSMIVLAEWMTEDMIAEAANNASKVLGEMPKGLSIQEMNEGRCVQTLHKGPPTLETGIVSQIYHDYMPKNGFVTNGHYHEIYLTDARRVAPEKLRTVIRQPVRA